MVGTVAHERTAIYSWNLRAPTQNQKERKKGVSTVSKGFSPTANRARCPAQLPFSETISMDETRLVISLQDAVSMCEKKERHHVDLRINIIIVLSPPDDPPRLEVQRTFRLRLARRSSWRCARSGWRQRLALLRASLRRS